MVNDARNGNCKMKKVVVKDLEYSCLLATNRIEAAEQLMYNYGDESFKLFWRQKVYSIFHCCLFYCVNTDIKLCLYFQIAEDFNVIVGQNETVAFCPILLGQNEKFN